MAKGFTTDGELGSLRSKVGSPSGAPRMNRGPGAHTRGTKDAASPKNTGAGYADGNTRKSNYTPKNNGGGSGY
jgi:hypothetical protein